MKLKNVLKVAKRVFVKRKYKDILFRFVFREPKELLELYNAMNHTDYSNPEDLIITTMEDVVYMGMKNDLSFLVANELNLYEHQSTLNHNMPLRGLLYLAKMYESYIETHKLNRYQKKQIRLPFPRFVVFYNGEDDLAEELHMRLSDAFDNHDEEPAVECVARFVNINYGHNHELMDRCRRLHDYSYFVACVQKYLQQGYSLREAVVRAVDECIEKDILRDILVKNRAEVIDMFLTAFDKKMYEEALREEGRDEMAEKCQQLTTENQEMSKTIEEITKANEEITKANEEITKVNEEITKTNEEISKENETLLKMIDKHTESQRIQVEHLKAKGFSYEEVKEIMVGFSEAELVRIYAEH